MSGPQTSCLMLVDAHRPAQAMADSTGLPQTVFYHFDYRHSHIESGAKILRAKGTELFVTWLPVTWFDGRKS